MKKKSASRSAFFNLRVLIGLSIVLAGVLLALASSGVFSVAAQSVIQAMTQSRIITYSTDPLVPVGFDCSKIYEMGIDKQENFRAGAIMVACGEVPVLPPLRLSLWVPSATSSKDFCCRWPTAQRTLI